MTRSPFRLAAPALALALVATVARPADPVRLFNGKDLAGWSHFLVEAKVPASEVWSVADGGWCARASRWATYTPTPSTRASSS